MSSIVPLDALPNQELSILLDNDRYDISLRSSKTSSFVTITKNEVLIVENLRAVGGSPLVPYNYLFVNSGNFMFSTPNQEIPYYDKFGVSQFLVYLTAAEIEAARA